MIISVHVVNIYCLLFYVTNVYFSITQMESLTTDTITNPTAVITNRLKFQIVSLGKCRFVWRMVVSGRKQLLGPCFSLFQGIQVFVLGGLRPLERRICCQKMLRVMLIGKIQELEWTGHFPEKVCERHLWLKSWGCTNADLKREKILFIQRLPQNLR